MLKKSEYLQAYGSRREPSKEQMRIAELVAQAYTNVEIAKATGSTEQPLGTVYDPYTLNSALTLGPNWQSGIAALSPESDPQNHAAVT
jgi:hypothetical protein